MINKSWSAYSTTTYDDLAKRPSPQHLMELVILLFHERRRLRKQSRLANRELHSSYHVCLEITSFEARQALCRKQGARSGVTSNGFSFGLSRSEAVLHSAKTTRHVYVIYAPQRRELIDNNEERDALMEVRGKEERGLVIRRC